MQARGRFPVSDRVAFPAVECRQAKPYDRASQPVRVRSNPESRALRQAPWRVNRRSQFILRTP